MRSSGSGKIASTRWVVSQMSAVLSYFAQIFAYILGVYDPLAPYQ